LLGGLQINNQLELSRLHDRKFGGLWGGELWPMNAAAPMVAAKTSAARRIRVSP